MGYCTHFNLDVMGSINPIWDFMPKIKEMNEDMRYMFDDEGDSFDAYKWYDHEIDMKEISKVFPEVIFVLHGNGEESGDIWIKYFKNGKIQRCPAIVTFEEYNENKLK